MASKPLGELKHSKRPNLAELADYPTMTRWFNPGLLLKLLWRVVVSDLFEQYADRRLIEAALDSRQPGDPSFATRDDISASMEEDADGAVWIDFIADLGDGFDATYAVAYLLAQPHLTMNGRTLPRGSALIMGGDEVYPTATRHAYSAKLRAPYQFAFPDQRGGVGHPKLLALPGNHDWYDGLVNFLAIFCRVKSTSIGNWRTVQRRSYFAFKITDQFWVWGIDIALVADMDQPQADYFVAVAKEMPHDAHVILCSAEPGWYGAEQETNSYRTLSYAAWIAENAGKSIKIPLVLSGDTHHYSRYSSEFGTQYITSGGGGAFLHGTHQLSPVIHANWLRQHDAALKLETCYPPKEVSRSLLSGNLKFPLSNWDFALFLGAIYSVFGFVMSMLPRDDVYFIALVMLVSGFALYAKYQSPGSKKAIGFAVAHALVQYAVLYGLTELWMSLDDAAFALHTNATWWCWLIAFSIPMTFVGGIAAGFVFGLNLMLTCRYADLNHNDAFSAMRLNSFRSFLRIRVLGNQLCVYPIGIDRIPQRSEWRDGAEDDSASWFKPASELGERLIEPMIEIDGMNVDPMITSVKPASELPKS